MITLYEAQRLIVAAEAEARSQGQPMNIANVDAGGNLIAGGRGGIRGVGQARR